MKRSLDTPLTQLIALTQKLVRFKTITTAYAEQEKCLQFIRTYLSDHSRHKLYFRSFRSQQSPSLVVTNTPTDSPDIFLSGHIDVVDGDPSQFTPRVSQGRLYGRGSLDMKSGVAIMMQLLLDLPTGHPTPSLGLMLTSDEEVGGTHGTRYLLNQKKYSSRFTLVLEGAVKPQIINRQKGIGHIKVRTEGTSAHGAYPWLADNAATALLPIIARIQKYFGTPQDRWHTTCTLSKLITPASSINKLPEWAEAIFDVRFTEKTARSPHDILTLMQRLASPARCELLMQGTVLATDPHNRFIKMLQSSSRSLYSTPLPLGFSHGGSDGRFFAERGIPCVEYGPNGHGHHGNKEYVTLTSLSRVYHTLYHFLSHI